ncbi:acid phosphatase [Achromobacter xylosoxidans]|uniref:acid phosphatase n=1 Tax=Alcaligenes xylosoxydans xylosoxydans TaxID=85698 RepID=UPI0006C4CA0E|nr:acid phosphatase [Achromobacter xylosoxidans]CUJ39198.1 Uncharacterised protein [Achromobacter xylosoxidans]
MTTNPSLPPAATLAPGAATATTDEFRNPLSTSAWLLAGLGVALVAAVCALWVDLPLAIWIRQSVSDGVNTSFEWIGEMGESGRYIGVALAFYIVGLVGLTRGWRNPVRMSYASMARGSLLMLSTMAVGGLVATSRLVNLDHYLSDVLTAAAIAIAVGHLLAPRVLCSKYQWPLRAPWRWWKKG